MTKQIESLKIHVSVHQRWWVPVLFWIIIKLVNMVKNYGFKTRLMK